MKIITPPGRLYVKTDMGTDVEVIGMFLDVGEANAYMEENKEHGVVLEYGHVIYIAAMSDDGSTRRKLRTVRLSCCCCGNGFRGRQHWNQDTGHGLCDSCVDWIQGRKGYEPDDFKRTYGLPGVHYKLTADEVTT